MAKLLALTTSAGKVKTKTVINCAGAWSPTIGAMVGLEIPVQPLRRELLITEPLTADFDDVPENIANDDRLFNIALLAP